MYNLRGKKVWIAGHNGMVGRAVLRNISEHDCELLTAEKADLDLLNQHHVNEWLKKNKPDVVIICAAKVGGIWANSNYPVDFIYNNLMMECNIINASHLNDVEKLLFLGSSCIYPKNTSQPIVEKSLLTGPLEETNEWYAIAKISGIKLCQAYRKQYGKNFISAMPTNLYGPFDNFDLDSSHVIPALIRKFHNAKKDEQANVDIWGTGSPKREFLHVDDCASCLVHLLQYYSDYEHVNVGTGKDISINDLTTIIKDIVKYTGNIQYDDTKPDGTPRKLLDVTKVSQLNWKPKYKLTEGLIQTYDWFKSNY